MIAKYRKAVARIHCRGHWGAGFLVRDRFHLLTQEWFVSSGRTIRAVFGEGREIDGVVVSTDDANNLALVKLDEEAPGAPLQVSTQPLQIDEAVTVVAPAFEWRVDGSHSDDDWVLMRGRVAGVSEEFLKLDISLPGASDGAPLLGPDGGVVGMVEASDGIAFATPAGPIAAMESPAADESPDLGGIAPSIRFGYQMHVPTERVVAHGFSLGMGLVAWDQLTLDARIGTAFSGMIPQKDTELVDRMHSGANVDLELGYRLLLTPPDMVPLHVTFGAGGTYQHQTVIEKRGRVDGTQFVIERTERDESYLRPVFTAGLLTAGLIDMSYQFELDPESPADSGHRVLFEIVLE